MEELEHIANVAPGQTKYSIVATLDQVIFRRIRGDVMSKTVHLIKLSVGSEDVPGLTAWQSQKRAQAPDGNPRHITRMWPKRAEEVLNGGSIYWVIKGVILCRQPILRLDEYRDTDGIRRCSVVCKPGLIRVEATPKRAFQGWRYLNVDDAPSDLAEARQHEEALPPALTQALAEIGVR